MHRTKRVIALLLVLVAVAGLAACGSGGKQASDGDDSERTVMITVRDGEPVGGIAELEYDAGEQVSFQVNSDKADEVHVHGYDVEEEIPAGGAATLSFPADIEGIFEVELHGSEKQIAELRVNP